MQRTKYARTDARQLDISYVSPAPFPRLATPIGPSTWPSPQTEQARGPQTPSWQHRGPKTGPAEPVLGGRDVIDTAKQDAAPARLVANRWLACCYKAGQLGVAAYDRMTNEVVQITCMQTGLLCLTHTSEMYATLYALQSLPPALTPSMHISPASRQYHRWCICCNCTTRLPFSALISYMLKCSILSCQPSSRPIR